MVGGLASNKMVEDTMKVDLVLLVVAEVMASFVIIARKTEVSVVMVAEVEVTLWEMEVSVVMGGWCFWRKSTTAQRATGHIRTKQ